MKQNKASVYYTKKTNSELLPMVLRIKALLAALAVPFLFNIGFTSCSSSDDEPSVEEILSNETTPIDFEIDGYSKYGSYNYFDYAGNHYIGSGTITKSTCTLDLRQGKHHIVWISGLGKGTSLYTNGIETEYADISYDADNKTITAEGTSWQVNGVAYFEKDIDVTPYLMPIQKVKFANYATSLLYIEITDLPQDVELPQKFFQDAYGNFGYIGKITGLPYVKTVSLTDNNNKLKDEGADISIYAYFNRESEKQDIITIVAGGLSGCNTLCPFNGLTDIHLKADIQDINGKSVPTTSLPAISMKRGYVTYMRGPLFSGSSSDWKVTQVPFEDWTYPNR